MSGFSGFQGFTMGPSEPVRPDSPRFSPGQLPLSEAAPEANAEEANAGETNAGETNAGETNAGTEAKFVGWSYTQDPPRLFQVQRSCARVSKYPPIVQKFFDKPLEQMILLCRATFSPEAQSEFFGNRPLEKIYSVPRRFDISTLFVVSTAFALMFALMGYIGATWPVKLGWCFYVSGVGFAQAAIFQARAPRAASVFAGGLLLSLVGLVAVDERAGGGVCMAIGMFILGLPCGYIVGTIVGGVFLVADKVRKHYFERSSNLKPVIASDA